MVIIRLDEAIQYMYNVFFLNMLVKARFTMQTWTFTIDFKMIECLKNCVLKQGTVLC